MALPTSQQRLNADLWRSAGPRALWANRVLRPVEVMLLVRYREGFSGRVLELGCGGGRLLGYFLALGADTSGIDISPAMVEYCRRTYPAADVRVGDLSEVGATWDKRSLDVVFPSYNVIDVLDDSERRRVLSELKELLAPDGLLVFSTHNLDAVGGDSRPRPSRTELVREALYSPPSRLVGAVRKLPERRRNRRRLGPLEQHHDTYAILNDVAENYGVLHYYIRRDDQERQLRELGYELIECLDLEGERVEPGQASASSELHFVARTDVRGG
jgi:SAM-dependent methyltransferase